MTTPDQMVGKESKERDSSIELLRILSIILIIVHHVCIHGHWTSDYSVYSPESFFLNCLSVGGKIGVDCFIIISGYYLIKTDRSNYLKIIRLWISMLFYSVLISLVFFTKYDYPCNSLTIFQMLTPILNDTWWFMSSFIIMLLLSPLLNKIAINIDKRTYLSFILIFTVIWSFVPTVTSLDYDCSNVLWFCLLYMIAGFIRLYPKSFNGRIWTYIMIILICLVVTYLSIFIICYFDSDNPLLDYITRECRLFALDRSLTILLISLSIFLLFRNIGHFTNRAINIIASATLGIYLIHDHPLIREKIYNNLFHCVDHYGFPEMISYCLFVTFTIYVTSLIIELIRIYIIDRPFMDLITPFLKTAHEKYQQWLNIIAEKIKN